MVRPSRRREMAQKAVEQRGVSVRLACRMFNVSESCYRYQAKLRAEDDVIADWLVRLTTAHRSWGFGLCFPTSRASHGTTNGSTGCTGSWS